MTNTSWKRGPGQPPKERQIRYPIRIHEAERETWRVAAARAGIQILDWIPVVLNGEAQDPVHVPPLADRRASRAGTLDAHRVCTIIERAAERQLATAEVARRILALAPESKGDLLDLIRQVAANAANPIANEAADAVEAAIAEATQGVRDP